MITQTTPLPTAEPTRTSRSALVAALSVGLVLGPLDLGLQHLLGYPWANLANSSAVWAIVAFALGYTVPGRRRWLPALAATVALVVAVESYYLAAVLTLGDDPSTMVDAAGLRWLIVAVGAGVIFGTAGAWARNRQGGAAALGTAFAPAVLFAEAVLDGHRALAADVVAHDDLIQTAVILVALGLVAALLAGREPRQRLLGLGLSLPLTALGAAAFVVLGFG